MRISGTSPSSVVLSQTRKFKIVEKWCQKVPKQAKAKSDLKIFRTDIQNASTTPSRSDRLRIVNNVKWESRNITIQPVENLRKESHRVCRKRW